ncbi:hypothetical protein ACFFX0_16445 [Citricoccus parietis]|uniref:Uncharacterized protein n=1 Tax=Citricoccus parietis TaxID=592307 RepID=A0ABV5G1C0_9MICC
MTAKPRVSSALRRADRTWPLSQAPAIRAPRSRPDAAEDTIHPAPNPPVIPRPRATAHQGKPTRTTGSTARRQASGRRYDRGGRSLDSSTWSTKGGMISGPTYRPTS